MLTLIMFLPRASCTKYTSCSRRVGTGTAPITVGVQAISRVAIDPFCLPSATVPWDLLLFDQQAASACTSYEIPLGRSTSDGLLGPPTRSSCQHRVAGQPMMAEKGPSILTETNSFLDDESVDIEDSCRAIECSCLYTSRDDATVGALKDSEGSGAGAVDVIGSASTTRE